MKTLRNIIILLAVVFISQSVFAQRILIGPRLSGNFNIYNSKGLTGTWNGLGIGVGGTVDILFSKSIGLMVNLTAFDMRNFSSSQTQQNVTTETSLSLSYLSIDPMFKAEFSGFYMVGGPSLGIKLNSSGEQTQSATGQQPQVNPINPETKSVRFDLAVGTGYTFTLSQDMYMGTDFIAHIPITDTYNFPGVSNSVFTLKLGVSLKFKI
ncbi:MAG: outer membrane beta-barrel protein [Ignavibacteriales bacterium]|nr:MAG: outer membrane beta-barrel protein [Ignavibacteriales bacterium]